MKRTYLIFAGVILVLSACGLVLYDWLSRDRDTLTLPGIVEIQEVRLASKVGGRVVQVHVREGDLVSPGQPLVTFDVPELEKQHAQQEARVAQLWQELKKAENGPRPEEIAAARAELGAAKAKLDRTEAGFRDEEKLQAQSDMESAQADFKQAEDEFGASLVSTPKDRPRRRN